MRWCPDGEFLAFLRAVFSASHVQLEPAIPALFPNTGISVLEKINTGINTGIQQLPILAVLEATKCKQCVVNDRLMSA